MNIIETLKTLAGESGISGLISDPRYLIMIVIACFLLFLGIGKKFEPLLMVPIAFGMLLANLPLAGMMGEPTYNYYVTPEAAFEYADTYGKEVTTVYNTYFQVGDRLFLTEEEANAFMEDTGAALLEGEKPEGQYMQAYQVNTANGGLLYYLYKGVKLGIYPSLIFMGVGAMTDFGPLIANPKSLLLGAAAQLGIFLTYIICNCLLGFTEAQSGAIGIIGGADGPTAIYTATRLAPELLGPIAVAAYSYMALVPVIQPPIMKALTTKKERSIVMEQLRPVSKKEKIIFPIMVTIVVSLLLPSAAPLIGCLMLGNLFREAVVTDRLSKTAQNELCNIVTIFLGVTVGATTNAQTFLNWQTLKILIVGIVAFSGGTAGGVLFGKLMCKVTHGKVNPLIGSAGVSAVPMAARVSQTVGQKENPGNFLLMHAMGPNVAGVIGSAIAAGVFLSMF